MSTAQALQDLLSDPKTFMKTKVLVISGGKGCPAGTATFKFEDNGKGGYKATYLSSAEVGTNTHEFQAFYVPMVEFNEFETMYKAVRLPTDNASPPFMVTSQITACMFAVGRSAKDTWVAHIQPDQTAHSDDQKYKDTDAGKHSIRVAKLRQKDLRAAVKKDGLKPFVAKGKTFSDMERVAVVGKRDANGHWKIFAQRMSEKVKPGVLQSESVAGIMKF